MPNIKDIEQAVKNFSDDELRRFKRWFADYDAKAWDAQIEADTRSGKLDGLAKSAVDAHFKGQSKAL